MEAPLIEWFVLSFFVFDLLLVFGSFHFRALFDFSIISSVRSSSHRKLKGCHYSYAMTDSKCRVTGFPMANYHATNTTPILTNIHFAQISHRNNIITKPSPAPLGSLTAASYARSNGPNS